MQIISRTRTLCQEPVCDNYSLGEIIARKFLLQMENVHEKRVYIIMSNDVNVESILLILLHPRSKDGKGGAASLCGLLVASTAVW